MNISQAGVDAIKRHEGLRLWAYLDSASVPTIGYGHTAGVHLGDHIDDATAEQYLRADLEWVETAINNAVRVPLAQAQYDALCSFVFNVGATAFKNSTLLEKLNAGDLAGAAAEFPRWDKATVNGEKVSLPGLVTRRQAERAMFLSQRIDTSPEPVEARPADRQAPPRPDAEPYTTTPPEPAMAIPAIVTALLPTVVQMIPRLAGIFKPGSAVAERNVAAASAVIDIVTQATGAVNAQAAVEAIQKDPAALAAATKAVETRWLEVTETGGGGIEGARKADAAAMASDGPWWAFLKSPSFWMLVLSLPLVYIVIGSIAGLWGYTGWSDDVRASLATAVVSLIIGGSAGYFWGQTTSRNRPPAP